MVVVVERTEIGPPFFETESSIGMLQDVEPGKALSEALRDLAVIRLRSERGSRRFRKTRRRKRQRANEDRERFFHESLMRMTSRHSAGKE